MLGQVVLVTGSTRGIGKAVAIEFLMKGANVVVNGRANKAPEWLSEWGNHAHYIAGEVQVYDQASRLLKETLATFGRLDVLVNNAGITQDKLLMRMTPDDFNHVIQVNLTGTFNMIQASTSHFLKQKSGSIINLTSVVALTGNAGQANYAASKAGVIGLTKSVARELASRNIRCNAIAPGYIETEMTASLSDKVKDDVKNQIPLKKFGQPKDVADVAYFLAKQGYITGQVINIDGGMVMQ